MFLSHAQHHKHSYYVIRGTDRLAGFNDDEVERIALVARYHRKSEPKAKHPEFAALDEDDQHEVAVLAGLLRVAIGLDRNHAGRVAGREREGQGRAPGGEGRRRCPVRTSASSCTPRRRARACSTAPCESRRIDLPEAERRATVAAVATRVLVIDNYDSFVYNLVQYLGELGAEPLVHRHDELRHRRARRARARRGADLTRSGHARRRRASPTT